MINRSFSFSFHLVFFFCLAAALPALGGKSDAESASENDAVIQVTGVVRLVGNEPFTELVITGLDHEWYIAENEKELFEHLQHRTVTVEGEETVIALMFASGLPAGDRRILSDIKIISVDESE